MLGSQGSVGLTRHCPRVLGAGCWVLGAARAPLPGLRQKGGKRRKGAGKGGNWREREEKGGKLRKHRGKGRKREDPAPRVAGWPRGGACVHERPVHRSTTQAP